MVFKEKVFVEEENLQDHQTRKKSKDKARDWKEKPYMESLLDKLPMKMAQE